MSGLVYEWEQDGFRVELLPFGRHPVSNKMRISFELRDNGKLIFKGDEFFLSPMYQFNQDEAVMELLGFLTLQPGDTDDEYFKDYTPEQLEWCKSSRADDLRYILNDFEDPEEEEVA